MSKVTDYVGGTAYVVGTIAVGAAVVAGTVLLASAVINSDCATVSHSPKSTRVSRTETACLINDTLSLKGPIPNGDLRTPIPRGNHPRDIRYVTFNNNPHVRFNVEYMGERDIETSCGRQRAHVSRFRTVNGEEHRIIWLPAAI